VTSREPVQVVFDALGRAGCSPAGEPFAAEALCPACRVARLTLRVGADGRAVVLCPGGCEPAVIAAALRMREAELLPGAKAGRPRTGRTVQLTPFSEVRERAVRWLWRPWVPLGKVTVLAGPPGISKSMLTALCAAQVSTGTADGHLAGVAADVLLASAEDDPEDTIKPRLMAAGADLERVHLIDLRTETAEGQQVAGLVELPGDVDGIANAVRETGARLVILDPVVAFLDGEHSAYSEQEVRKALAPLKTLAEETGCAVLVVMHLNKRDGSDPLRRIANSGAFTALARSVLLLGVDPEAEGDDADRRRVLTAVKGNVGPVGGRGVLLEIEPVTIPADGEEIETARLRVIGESRARAEDLLGEAGDRSALGGATRWLREALADGPVLVGALREAATEAGMAWRTVERAKSRVGIKPTKLGGPGAPWQWALIEAGSADASVKEPGDVGGLGGLTARTGDSSGGVTEDRHVSPSFTAKAANSATPSRQAGSPCPYDRHRVTDWRLAEGGPRTCGICHPPVPGVEAVRATEGA
jgi:putative DNA primase/helicase